MHSVTRMPHNKRAMLDIFSLVRIASGALANLFLTPWTFNYELDQHLSTENEQADTWFWNCVWAGGAVA